MVRMKKLEEARQRKKLEMEQARHRQQQEVAENRIRRSQLKDSMLFFDAVRTAIEAIKDGERHERDWEKFMRCNGLPNAASPSDLRKYIHQWHTDIAKRQLESRNWLLRTDERTLLTQDAQVADLTRISLRQQQGSLGDVFAQRIKEVLGVSRPPPTSYLLTIDSSVLSDPQRTGRHAALQTALHTRGRRSRQAEDRNEGLPPATSG